MQFWIGCLVGVAVTSIIFAIAYLRCPKGTLRIDHFNPEKDLYRFEIDHLESINGMKRIVLLIDHNAQLYDYSQE